jgi:hypothetical protein
MAMAKKVAKDRRPVGDAAEIIDRPGLHAFFHQTDAEKEHAGAGGVGGDLVEGAGQA